MMKIIYINYIDMTKCLSGSSVRPIRIYEAMGNLGYEVELVTDIFTKHNIKERKKYLSDKLIKIRQDFSRRNSCSMESQ